MIIGIGIGIGFNNPIPPKVKFDLLENGLDFITEAVVTLNTGSNHKKLKYSLIHLCSGVELIFKEILHNKDWKLIFRNTNEAKIELLQSGDFESVSFANSIKRLESECNVIFSEDDKRTLIDFRNKRNKIEHFKINENVSSIKAISSKVLNIIIQIIHQKIEINQVSSLSQTYIRNLPKELSKFNNYVAERNQKIKQLLDQKTLNGLSVVKCPCCFQYALFLEKKPTCLFCNYTDESELFAVEICNMIEGDSVFPSLCGCCSKLSVIKINNKSICINCNDMIVDEAKLQ